MCSSLRISPVPNSIILSKLPIARTIDPILLNVRKCDDDDECSSSISILKLQLNTLISVKYARLTEIRTFYKSSDNIYSEICANSMFSETAQPLNLRASRLIQL